MPKPSQLRGPLPGLPSVSGLFSLGFPKTVGRALNATSQVVIISPDLSAVVVLLVHSLKSPLKAFCLLLFHPILPSWPSAEFDEPAFCPPGLYQKQSALARTGQSISPC